MAANRRAREFFQGLCTGLAVAGGVFLLSLQGTGHWMWLNLGYSVGPFLLLIALYIYHLRALCRELASAEPRQVVIEYLAHYLDLWSTVFFAVGVLWTAIGMRAALINALGAEIAIQALNPSELLSRLVDGGILLALSTTIAGSLGGYLMRLVKTWVVGRPLLYREIEQERRLFEGVEGHLGRIESLLTNVLSEIAPRPSKKDNN